MQVQPNSTIYLLAGVPIDKSYDYTLYFNSRGVQTAYMESMRMANGQFTAQQYTRVERNRLRVAVCADDVINCNYIMFKNNGTLNGNSKYANKWFYAFAHVQYVNEGACDVIFEIDDIQTWMFDYEFADCFVEREHSATDVAGDNLQPEPVDTGELVVCNEIISSFNDTSSPNAKEYMFGAIITNKRIDNEGLLTININAPTSIPNLWHFNVAPIFMPTEEYRDVSSFDASSGISCGLYIYTGLLINENDWEDFYKSRLSLYNMYDPEGTPNAPFVPSNDPPILTLGMLISLITNNHIQNISTSENNIVACYQYPAGFNLKTAENNATASGFKRGICEFKSTLTAGNPFLGTYTPVNNKLKTAPYCKVYATSETGATGEYRYEFFPKDAQNRAVVSWSKIGTYFGQPSGSFVPTSYKGKDYDYDSALVTSPYPVPIYSGDAFTSWWQQNKTSFLLGGISSIIALGMGVGSGRPSQIYSAGSALAGSIGTAIDKSNIPPNVYYQAQNEALNVGTNRIRFKIYQMCITPEYARKIDSYFTKYGYAVNEVKIPNLQRGLAKRQNWNYLKVRNCMLNGILPSDVEEHLEQIYERGITFWNYTVTVGDYSIANPIVTP